MNTTHHVHVPEWMKRIWDNPPDPIVYMFPSVADWDMRTLEIKLSVIGTTFAAATVVFALSYVASYLLVKTFRDRLRRKEKVFWCLAFVRALFGFVASFFGAWYLAFDDTLQRDVVYGHSQTSFFAVYITIGFFLFECLMMFSSNIIFRNFDPFLAAHHIISLIGYSACAYYSVAHFFTVVALLLEMTTPFTCFCWMLLKAKKADLLIWQLNQLILVHLFHCRTTIEGFFYYKTYYQWSNIRDNMPFPAKAILYSGLTLQFLVLTPYWTYKKMGQLYNPVDWNFPDSFIRRLSRTWSWMSNSGSSTNLNGMAVGDMANGNIRGGNDREPRLASIAEGSEKSKDAPLTIAPVPAESGQSATNGGGSRRRKKQKKK